MYHNSTLSLYVASGFKIETNVGTSKTVRDRCDVTCLYPNIKVKVTGTEPVCLDADM